MHATSQLNAALTGRYAVDHLIGEGGMATVYLARDVRHQRQVALKVLKPDLGAVVGVDRFLSEIQVTAKLQHPNLLPLFDSGEADGLLYYVMPYVDGESLRARLTREKQLPVDEALRIATAIAGALDYAHRHGVIHRDLKPENILLHEGQPLVADFGIALAVSNAGGNRITQTGLSLGTPQYMSPEQATGDRTIDARSDIYSLGAVTYEMLTGEPPHVGSTSQAIIARVLTEKPRPIRASRPSVPEHVEATIDRALEKLPADRFATAHEFAAALQGSVAVAATRRVEAAPAAVRTRAGWRTRVADPFVLAPALLCVVLGGLLVARGRAAPARPDARAIRFAIEAPDKGTVGSGLAWPAAISPDGENIVFTARDSAGTMRLYVRRVDELSARPIPGTENGQAPTFSPDGAWLEFEVGNKYKKVRLDGSAPVAIAGGAAQNGTAWTTRDDLILGVEGNFHGLSRVSAAGGEPAALTHPDSAKGERDHLWPVAHDDGKTIAFVIWYGDLASSRLALTSVDDGKVRPLGIPGARALAFIGDELVYVQVDGSVMAVTIDRSHFKAVGSPFPVHDPVAVYRQTNGNSDIFVSPTGGLVTVDAAGLSRLAWLDGTRGAQPVLRDERRFSLPKLSPDGARVVVRITDGSASDSWIVDLKSSTLTRLTTLETVSDNEWTADGRNVLTTAGPGDIYLESLDASPPRLIARLVRSTSSATISPDGASLVAQAYGGSSWDLVTAGADSSARARNYVATPANETEPRFSPDGEWIVMASDEAGSQGEVFIRSFPEASRRVQVSAGGGAFPIWSRDGKSITYLTGDALVRARTSGPPEFQILGRDTVLVGAGRFGASFDIAADGRVLAAVKSTAAAHAVVVPNWIVEFRQREKAAKRR